MITTEKYKEILEEGLSLDHYYVLALIYNNQPLPDHKRVEGFTNLLAKMGYIEDGVLTDKAIELVQDELFGSTLVSVETTTTTAPVVLEFNDWIFDLHKKLEDKLVELTGKKQQRHGVKGGKLRSFLCNPLDLGKNVKKVMTSYKIDDREKIEKALIRHIEDCNKAKHWFPIMFYYISKDGQSQLVTDLETVEDTTEEPQSTQNTIDDSYVNI